MNSQSPTWCRWVIHVFASVSERGVSYSKLNYIHFCIFSNFWTFLFSMIRRWQILLISLKMRMLSHIVSGWQSIFSKLKNTQKSYGKACSIFHFIFYSFYFIFYCTESPYQHLEKSTVLQSARIFHDPVIVRNDPRRCCTVIGQLLHLQNGMGVSKCLIILF